MFIFLDWLNWKWRFRLQLLRMSASNLIDPTFNERRCFRALPDDEANNLGNEEDLVMSLSQKDILIPSAAPSSTSWNHLPSIIQTRHRHNTRFLPQPLQRLHIIIIVSPVFNISRICIASIRILCSTTVIQLRLVWPIS